MPDNFDANSQNPYASPQCVSTPQIGEGEPRPCAPCPRCGRTDAKPVPYRWWRGRQGPLLMDHVQCPSCGAEYNGRNGGFNTRNVIEFYVSAVAGVLIVVGLAGLALARLIMQF